MGAFRSEFRLASKGEYLRDGEAAQRLPQLRQVDGILIGLADAAVQGVAHDQGPVGALMVAVDLEDEGVRFDVLSAEGTAAETATAMSGTFAVPAVHDAS
jgi:hypothetical protein